MRLESAIRSFIILFAVIALYRVSLLDRGATAFVDETLYFTSVMALQSAAAGDVRGALKHITEARGRQGAAILNLPVAAVQAIPHAFGIAASNPRSLLIPACVNVLISIATLYFFAGVCLALTRDRWATAAATILYALLVNTNLYLRHLLPYDLAQCVAMLAVWLSVVQFGSTARMTVRHYVITGALAGAVITIYSGYYVLAFAVAVAILGPALSQGWRPALRFAAMFAIGAAGAIGAVEIACRGGGVSYIEASRVLSRTITFGSFDEGWSFLPEYLLRVERLSGLVLMAGTMAYVAGVIARIRRRSLVLMDWLVVAALAGWMWQAFLAAQLHTMVLYGRLIHPWMLFMALAVAGVLASIGDVRLRKIACGVVVACAGISWVLSAPGFYRLAYPPDVLYRLGIDASTVPVDRTRCELTEGTAYASPAPLDRRTNYPYANTADVLLVNFCQGPPLGHALPPLVIDEHARLYDGLHFLAFPAYAYEGFTPSEREDMFQHGYRVQVYRVAAP